jgi:hypothetical protein
MGTIISWMRATGGWVRSPFGDLPMLRVDDTAIHQTWLILAGGIGLILSRASRAELESRFSAAQRVYVIARTRLQKKRLPKPDPELLRDALQEIANLTDPMTKEAGRECLMRCVERAVKARGGVLAAEDLPATLASASATTQQAALSTQAHHPSTQAQSTVASHSTQTSHGSGAEDADHEATKIDLDLLFERSNKLRGTVAWARSTTFGQDS